MKVTALSLLLLCAVLPVPVAAQTADRPEIRVGDRWHFAMHWGDRSTKVDLLWEVTSVGAERIEVAETTPANPTPRPVLMTRELNVLESQRRKDSDLRQLSFPLAVGKSWTFENDYKLKDSGVSGHASYEVKVVGYEKVKVPAGEFDAFKVDAVGRWSAAVAGQSTATRVWWYAPAARAIVRDEWRNPPYRPLTVFELESFTPAR
ncbi:MAG: hypothetical protein IV094_16825 [Vitreoscilla sp.]|nr:hypothetical protein [Vitreoscilla sp.]